LLGAIEAEGCQGARERVLIFNCRCTFVLFFLKGKLKRKLESTLI
jgi:hypothetical protein